MAEQSEDAAAAMIQRAWRRHIDIQVYKYYRDLINFKQKGDPSAILKCINPIEAQLLDAASGAHVKFRLAGEKFPPNIYYKIYTHRPVQDLCANSPKDYTSAAAKLRDARQVHNHLNHSVTLGFQYLGGNVRSDDKEGWYQRWENNGWRLVSDRMLTHMLSDPVTWDSSNKKMEFHHDKFKRKVDMEKKRKERKISWLRKMHVEGMLRTRGSVDPETAALVQGATVGMLAAADRLGPDHLEDWEVDELLQWTTGLNFDEYVEDWKGLATTAGSEDKVELRANLYTDEVILTEPSPVLSQPSFNRARTGVSHNTPVSLGPSPSRLTSGAPSAPPVPQDV